MKFNDIKREWLNGYLEQLKDKGVSKAEISRRLGILPQSLNNILNGNRGVSDSFIDSLLEAFGTDDKVAKIITEKTSLQETISHEDLTSILDWIDRTSIIFEDMPGAFVNSYELKDLLLKAQRESKPKNIFANAVRGDKFRTRNGELAIYLGSTDDRTSYLIYEDNQIRTVFNDTGCYNYLACFTNPEDYLLSIDIISRWEDR